MKRRTSALLLAIAMAIIVTACGNPVMEQEAAVDNVTTTEENGVKDEEEPVGAFDEAASEPEIMPTPMPATEPSPTDEPTSAVESIPTAEPTPESTPRFTEPPVVTEEPAAIPEVDTEIPGSEEVDAKTAAARAKIAEAEANMDFFSLTPQDYVDAGYLSEEAAGGFMQEQQPVQEASVPEAPAPAVSSDIFGKVNNMTDAQYAAVLPVLQDMATTALATGTTDLEHVRAASQMVYAYAANSVYTTEGNYNKPYGLIFEGVYTCAGTCRTTAMVLILMGYPDVTCHNLSQWAHQWVTLTMDGQAGWADGIAGIADYGTYPMFGDGAPGYYEDPVTGLIWYY